MHTSVIVVEDRIINSLGQDWKVNNTLGIEFENKCSNNYGSKTTKISITVSKRTICLLGQERNVDNWGQSETELIGIIDRNITKRGLMTTKRLYSGAFLLIDFLLYTYEAGYRIFDKGKLKK